MLSSVLPAFEFYECALVKISMLTTYKKKYIIDCWLKKVLPPPLGNFADIVYLKEQSFLIQMRDVCTLYAGA